MPKGKTKTIENHTKGRRLRPNEGTDNMELAEFQNCYGPVTSIYIPFSVIPNESIQIYASLIIIC